VDGEGKKDPYLGDRWLTFFPYLDTGGKGGEEI
jgi:hypothetical protein